MKEIKKIVLTGGHAGTTALAVIEEIQAQKKPWQVHWIGPKKTFEGKGIISYHSNIFPKLGVSYHSIFSGRIQRKLSFWSLPSLLKIPFGFLHAFSLLMKIKPQLIVSFGGFASFPVVVVGFFLRVPVIIHEQTSAVGRANKASSFFARKIAIARESSKKFFNSKKTVLVGNPLMKSVLIVKPKSKLLSVLPTIYITGGSSGALFINNLIEGILEPLLAKFKVIHQTGQIDFEKFSKKKKFLPRKLSERYEVVSFVNPLKIGQIYEKADFLISRAGANTVAEIIYTQRPSILIPIPWTAYNEQGQNAKLVENLGLGIVLPQDQVSGKLVLEKAEFLLNHWQNFKNKASDLAQLDELAASKMVELINGYLPEK